MFNKLASSNYTLPLALALIWYLLLMAPSSKNRVYHIGTIQCIHISSLSTNLEECRGVGSSKTMYEGLSAFVSFNNILQTVVKPWQSITRVEWNEAVSLLVH